MFGTSVRPEVPFKLTMPHHQSFKLAIWDCQLSTSNVHGGSDNVHHAPQRPLYLRTVVRYPQADSAVELLLLLASVASIRLISVQQDAVPRLPT